MLFDCGHLGFFQVFFAFAAIVPFICFKNIALSLFGVTKELSSSAGDVSIRWCTAFLVPLAPSIFTIS